MKLVKIKTNKLWNFAVRNSILIYTVL